MVRQEMKICEMLEPLGFDIIWSAEHHFDHYSVLPDNLQALTYLAGRTKADPARIGGGDPALEQSPHASPRKSACWALCDGRFVFGMGRGLARREYDVFGIDMSEARERFNEAAKMILKALETGVIEGDGPFYKQKRTAIRPRPTRTFTDRTLRRRDVAESAPIVAELGAAMMFFNLFDIERHLPGVEAIATTSRRPTSGRRPRSM